MQSLHRSLSDRDRDAATVSLILRSPSRLCPERAVSRHFSSKLGHGGQLLMTFAHRRAGRHLVSAVFAAAIVTLGGCDDENGSNATQSSGPRAAGGTVDTAGVTGAGSTAGGAGAFGTAGIGGVHGGSATGGDSSAAGSFGTGGRSALGGSAGVSASGAPSAGDGGRGSGGISPNDLGGNAGALDANAGKAGGAGTSANGGAESGSGGGGGLSAAGNGSWPSGDEFEGAALSTDWTVFRPDLADVVVKSGALSLTPHGGAAWYQANQAVLVYKLVNGDFKVTASVHARRASNPDAPPNQFADVGGLMARNPNGSSENYVLGVIGFAEMNQLAVEHKSTLNSKSEYGEDAFAADAELRLCRTGATFTIYYRHPGDSGWPGSVAPISRADLPQTLQVGMVAYTGVSKPDYVSIFDRIAFEPLGSGCDR